MRIEFDTETLSETDRAVLRILGEDQSPTPEPVEVPENEPKEVKKKKWVAIYGRKEQIILEIIKYLGGAKAYEIAERCPYSVEGIGNVLCKLKKEGKVETSSAKPYTYYIRGENTEVKELLKNVKTRIKVA
jgi:predicted HTH transcriptional regulator